MTMINGANHNVEDILASIRTSIADEPGPARLIASEMNLPARRDMADDTSEFELPAIFKPGHVATAEKPKLFGRLSDALKSTAGAEETRGRTVIPFDPSVAGRMLEPPSGTVMQATQPEMPADAKSEPDEPVKRVMPTFFDTRINRLGELTRQAFEPKPEPVPEPAPQPAPVAAQPPALPDVSHAQHATEAVDDAAAQLLRPMLRQWLQDNMPKIVEKALLSEVQGSPIPKPRK